MSIKVSREMQLDRDEFLRELAKAVDQPQQSITGNKVVVKDGERRVEITLLDEGNRQMGALQLPMERVEFEFIGYSQQEVDAFMERFTQRTMRTGGM